MGEVLYGTFVRNCGTKDQGAGFLKVSGLIWDVSRMQGEHLSIGVRESGIEQAKGKIWNVSLR